MQTLKNLSNDQLIEYYNLHKQGLAKSGRFYNRKVHGIDTKFMYNLVRLIYQCYQILTQGELNLQENKDELKAVRQGQWSEQRFIDFLEQKMPVLERAYDSCKLPEKPDVTVIKNILCSCLEAHYGSLDSVLVQPDAATVALREIDTILTRVRSVL